MAYRVSQPLATSPSPNGDDKKKKRTKGLKTVVELRKVTKTIPKETDKERRARRYDRYKKNEQKKKLAAAKNAPKMPTRPATKIKSKGPNTLVTKPTKKKRTVVKYTDKDGSKVKSVERRSGKLIETRKKKGGKHSSYKSKKITNKDGSVRVKTKYSY
jgi:hypothetical protein